MQEQAAATVHLRRLPLNTTGPDGRLAELVAHLTGCPPTAAVDAVAGALPDDLDDLSNDDRLGVVAAAMVAVTKEHGFDVGSAQLRRRAV